MTMFFFSLSFSIDLDKGLNELNEDDGNNVISTLKKELVVNNTSIINIVTDVSFGCICAGNTRHDMNPTCIQQACHKNNKTTLINRTHD